MTKMEAVSAATLKTPVILSVFVVISQDYLFQMTHISIFGLYDINDINNIVKGSFLCVF